MNKITEKSTLFVQDVLVSGTENKHSALRFEVVCASRSLVLPGFSTLWRELPFHMLSVVTDIAADTTTSMRLKNAPDIIIDKPCVLFIPAGTLHRIDDYSAPSSVVWTHFRLPTVYDTDFFAHCKIKPFIATDGIEEFEKIIWEIINICRSPEAKENEAWLQLYGMSLAHRILETADIKWENISCEISGSMERLLPAVRLLESSISKPDTELLAAKTHFSPSRFLAVFKQEFGISPGQYFRNIKFTKACRLLADPLMSVTRCADLLGYTDVFHFSREFRKKSGHSPSEYRKLIH